MKNCCAFGLALGASLCLAPLAPLAWAQTPPAPAAQSPASAPAAAPKPAALAALETMVANLGYTTTDLPDNQHFSIVWTAKYTYEMVFDVSQDGNLSYVFAALTDATPAQVPQIPYLKMLQADDTDDFYFSIESKPGGVERIFGNLILPRESLTPSVLRQFLTGFARDLDNSAADWNPKLWQ